MEQDLQLNHLKAFDMVRAAAREYNDAEYKFYKHGFFKFVREGEKTLLIEDIYIAPEWRSTPLSSSTLQLFESYMRGEGILLYYGRVFRASPQYKQRMKTFESWGMRVLHDPSGLFSIVSKEIKYLGFTDE